MNAVYHSWNVFPVIDICCFWIEYLENKRKRVYYILLFTIILTLPNDPALIVFAVTYFFKHRETSWLLLHLALQGDQSRDLVPCLSARLLSGSGQQQAPTGYIHKKASSTEPRGSFTPQGVSRQGLCFLQQSHSCDCPVVPWPQKGVLLTAFYYTVKNLATQFCKHVCTHMQYTLIFFSA